MLDLIALLLVISAVFAYLNHRFLKLPTTIGLMAISLLFSLLLIATHSLGLPFEHQVQRLLTEIDFEEALMNGMLAFLLFAGAQHVKLSELKENWKSVGLLATFGVLLSTFLVGTSSYYLLHVFGLNVGFIYCMLFGALISPTDPIAVLSLLKHSDAPRKLHITIAGESLFNDGVGVVIFVVILGLLSSGSTPQFSSVALIFGQEAVGGILLGLVLGLAAFYMLKSIDNYLAEVLITLALVTGGYSLATHLHTSGPIAMVVAGILIGNQGRAFAMSDKTREHIDMFWLLTDEILNAVLFVIIGLEVLLISFSLALLAAGFCCTVIVLISRFVSVSIPLWGIYRADTFPKNTAKVLTWGGLRGGISVALALSIPAGPERMIILVLTYVVVVISVLGQGLSFNKFLRAFPVE
ncbi:MAG: sodium:proton antiporter [Ignavibacteria bacterium]|nr:sodium:proton antiporter [Ignavibacteria bacterium]